MDKSFKYQSLQPLVEGIEETYVLLQNYRTALDYHAIVSITDVEGVITYVNNLFCKISQYTYKELIGRTHNIVNSKSHDKEFFQDLWKTITQGKVWSGIICNKTKSGSLYWVKTTIFPFKDKSDEIHSYVSVHTDITEQINSQKELETTKKLLEAEKVALMNKNAAFIEMLSYLEEEKNKMLTSISSNFDLKIFPILQNLKSENPVQDKCLQLLITNLKEIAEPLLIKADSFSSKLTPKERQICSFIKQGLSAKEIATLMHLSPRTIEKHRANIRERLGVTDRKVNLASYLTDFKI